MSFFFNDTTTTEIYTLSLHDALPISRPATTLREQADTTLLESLRAAWPNGSPEVQVRAETIEGRSEEHTSELQSRQYLVCRLLLEKKNETPRKHHILALWTTYHSTLA